MPVLNFQLTSVGQAGVSPTVIYIFTNDTVAEVTQTGYLDFIVKQGLSLGTDDIALVTTKETLQDDAQANWYNVDRVNGHWNLTQTPPGGAAPALASYIVQHPEPLLTAAQALSQLSTGILKSETSTGVVSIAIPGVDYWQPGGTQIDVPDGGTGVQAFNAYGIILGGVTSTSPLQSLASTGTSGQTLISNGAGMQPTWGAQPPGVSSAAVILQTANAEFPSGQLTSALATGLLKNTTGTGVLSIGSTTTDYYAPGGGAQVAIADGGTAATTAAGARTNLGLGTIATQNSNNVTITGGSITGITALTVPVGGTGITSTTAYALLAGGTTSTGPIQSLAGTGTAGQYLVSNGAGALPTFQTPATLSVPLGGTGATTFTANAVLIGAGTSAIATAASGQSNVGYVLTSTGTGSAPTWQATSVVSGVSSITGTANQITASNPTGAVTLSLPNSVQINTSLIDSNVNTMLKFSATSSAANYFQMQNKTAGNPPRMSSQGVDADVGMIIESRLSNSFLQLDPGTINGGRVILASVAGSFSLEIDNTGFTFVTGGGTAYNLTLPLADGAAGSALTTDGAGQASWTPIGGGGTVVSVSGTANRITSTGGAAPVIDISAAYVGQASITTLGTITTGVWNGTPITLAGGGTSANLTASDGGIFYSNATTGAILAGTATAGQHLASGASSAPHWTTTTYPDTNAVNTLLYASSANVLSALATGNSGVLVTSAGGVPSISGTLPFTVPVTTGGTGLSSTTINQILYSSGANTIAGLATANNGVLVTSAGGVPSISSTLPTATTNNITTLGTITSGVWNGTVIDVIHGGSGVASHTAYALLAGGTTATGAVQSLASLGTSGQVLTSAGAGALPAWATLPTTTVPNGGTGTTSFTAYAPVIGGVTSTSALQSAATGFSNVGYVLTSTGSASAPTWQASAGGGSATLNRIAVNVTAAQIKTMAGTPVVMLASQGANTIIRVVDLVYEFTFVAPVYTGGGQLVVVYGPTNNTSRYASEITSYSASSGMVSSANAMLGATGTILSSTPSATVNAGIYLTNTGGVGSPFANGNGTLRVSMTYTVVSTVL